jgi:hypothetical protein
VLDVNEPVFPNNAVVLLSDALQGIDEDMTVLRRPLRPSDPDHSIGIFGSLWQPDEESYEMGHRNPSEPTLSSYQLGIQALIKDGDEERGLILHSLLSMRIRSVLYRNEALHVALGSLFVTDGTSVERTRRWGVRNQRYMNNDIEGKFVYLSTLEYWLETETS